MNRPFAIAVPPEPAFTRRGLFGIELLDPITLERVSDGVRVVAEGLRGAVYVNSGGLFVWLHEDITKLRKVSIDPRTLPYDSLELLPAQLNLPSPAPGTPTPTPITTIALPPRTDYPLSAGITAAHGTLIEERIPSPQPVRDADVHLRWLDEDATTWRDAVPVSRTNAHGDFVAVLRLATDDVPAVDTSGAVTARLHVRRGANERMSADFKLRQGHVADPSTLNALVFAWDELQP